MTITGSGFASGDTVDLTASGISTSVAVATDGTFVTTVAAPVLGSAGPGSKQFTLTAKDVTNGSTGASTSFGVANLAFTTKPASASPDTRVRFSFSGFKPDAVIYGHYLLNGKVSATASFGRTRGSCGLLTAKARLFPGGHPHFGSYKVQFDDTRKYRAHSVPRIVSGLTIRRA